MVNPNLVSVGPDASAWRVADEMDAHGVGSVVVLDEQGAALGIVTDRDLAILIPAYVVSELTRAFEIGFLLYLPFIIVDLVITNILTAMGMLMVSPTLIALPFKLFLFVVIDGWSRLAHGLVLSYA